MKFEDDLVVDFGVIGDLDDAAVEGVRDLEDDLTVNDLEFADLDEVVGVEYEDFLTAEDGVDVDFKVFSLPDTVASYKTSVFE